METILRNIYKVTDEQYKRLIRDGFLDSGHQYDSSAIYMVEQEERNYAHVVGTPALHQVPIFASPSDRTRLKPSKITIDEGGVLKTGAAIHAQLGFHSTVKDPDTNETITSLELNSAKLQFAAHDGEMYLQPGHFYTNLYDGYRFEINTSGAAPYLTIGTPDSASRLTPTTLEAVVDGEALIFNYPDRSGQLALVDDIPSEITDHQHKYTPSGTVSQPTFSGTTSSGSTIYTPVGAVSQPTFTGQKGNAAGKYTPAGTVSQPTFTGTPATLNVNLTPVGTVSTPTITVEVNTTTVQSLSSAGTLPAMTTEYDKNTQTLSFTWSAGSLPTTSPVTVANGIKSATSTQPTFTGTEGTATINYTPAGQVSQPTFSGTQADLSLEYTPKGTVSQPTFTGTEATINISITPQGTVSQPTFTGNEDSTGQPI